MLLAGCSTVCTTVAEAAKMWNLIVVSTHLALYLSLYAIKKRFSRHTKNATKKNKNHRNERKPFLCLSNTLIKRCFLVEEPHSCF